MTNTSELIIQLESPASKQILLECKMPNDFSLLSGTGIIVAPEIGITRKKEYEITRNVASKKGSSSKSR